MSSMNLRATLLALICVAAWLASMINTAWPGLLRPADTASYLQSAVEEVSHLALWVAAWSWVSYTRQGQTQLATHTSMAALAGLIDNVVLSLAVPWAFFVLGWPWPSGLGHISRAVLIALLGLLHLRVACGGLNLRRWGLWLLASTVALTLVTASRWVEDNNTEALRDLPYQSNIYPADWIQRPEHGVEDGLKAMWEREWRQDQAADHGQ